MLLDHCPPTREKTSGGGTPQQITLCVSLLHSGYEEGGASRYLRCGAKPRRPSPDRGLACSFGECRSAIPARRTRSRRPSALHDVARQPAAASCLISGARSATDRLFGNRGPSIEFASTNIHNTSARRALSPALRGWVPLPELSRLALGIKAVFEASRKSLRPET